MNRIRFLFWGLALFILGEGGHAETIDLRSSGFGASGFVKLDRWGFTWQQFLQDGAQGDGEQVAVPGPLPHAEPGYGTYAVRVQLALPDQPRLGVAVGNFNPSMRAFVQCQGKLTEIFHNGRPAKTAKESILSMKPNEGFFPYCDDFYLLIHQSNLIMHQGGLVSAVYIGTEKAIRHKVETHYEFVLFAIGLLFTAMCFNFLLYFQRTEEKGSLYLALFCFCQILRYTCTEHLLARHFEYASTQAQYNNIRLTMVASVFILYFLIQYIRSSFPDILTKRCDRCIRWLVLAVCVMAMITTPIREVYVYGSLMASMVSWLACLYIVFRFIQFLRRQADVVTSLSFVGLCIYIFGMTYDAVAFVFKWDFYLAHYAAALFVGLQFQVLGVRFSRSFRAVSLLQKRLEHTNRELIEKEEERLSYERAAAEKNMIEANIETIQSLYGFLGENRRHVPRVKMARFYHAADHTGGDWLGMEFHPQTSRLYLMVGDVAGHGLLSSLTTMVSASAAKSCLELVQAIEESLSLKDALLLLARGINEAILACSPDDSRHMTMSFFCIDIDSGSGCYLNAGHPPSFLIASSGSTSLFLRGSPLGLKKDPVLEVKDFQFRPFDSLFAYTDGLFENEGPTGKRLRQRSVRKLFKHSSPPKESKEQLLGLCDELWQQNPGEDDCAFVILQWQGPKKGGQNAA